MPFRSFHLFVVWKCKFYRNEAGSMKMQTSQPPFRRIKVPGRKFLPSKNLRSNDPYVEIAHRVASDGAIRSAIQCHPLFVGRANNQQPCGTRFIPQTRKPLTLKGCVCLIFREILCFSRAVALFYVFFKRERTIIMKIIENMCKHFELNLFILIIL